MLLTMMKGMKDVRFAALAVALPLAACATWRWSGSPPREARTSAATADTRSAGGDLHPMPAATATTPEQQLSLTTTTAVSRPRVAVPPTPRVKLRTAAYPADLGPDAVDVSGYPLRIRADYRVYARVCSGCHVLSRANYSPRIERAWWKLYIARMRTRAAWKGSKLSRDEVRAILDFLDHDARARKSQSEFEQTNEELGRRFNAEVDGRMQRLQKGRPVLDGR